MACSGNGAKRAEKKRIKEKHWGQKKDLQRIGGGST